MSAIADLEQMIAGKGSAELVGRATNKALQEMISYRLVGFPADAVQDDEKEDSRSMATSVTTPRATPLSTPKGTPQGTPRGTPQTGPIIFAANPAPRISISDHKVTIPAVSSPVSIALSETATTPSPAPVIQV